MMKDLNHDNNSSATRFLPSHNESVCEIYDENEDNLSTCYSYKRNLCKCFLYYLLCILTVGLLLIVMYWKPKWKLLLTHSRCSLNEADKVLLVDQYGTIFVEVVNTSATSPWKLSEDFKQGETASSADHYKYFHYMRLKYYYNETMKTFVEVETFEDNISLYTLHQIPQLSSLTKRMEELSWFGPNVIDVKVKSYITLFFQESADPFYFFQLFSCILWFSDDYYYYAAVIVLISLVSIILSIYQTRTHLVTLHNMISKSSQVTILNGDSTESTISSEDLVPGDVLIVPKEGFMLPCDTALISGTAIVNESMLTGESVPVTKTPIPNPQAKQDPNNELYNTLKHKRHTLYCGTSVLQTRYFKGERVLAVVVKTGFTTMKGGLIRSILYPKAVDFKFFTDALKFVGVLGIFAVIGLTYSVVIFYQHGSSVGDIIKKALDVITIAVPPALPAAMSVGTVYALSRLKKKNIFCISPSRVNISGRLNLFCFDKTGTLTEDGLDFNGIVPSVGKSFGELQETVNLANSDTFTIGMASCHSLTIIDKKVTGDPLDMKMFLATDWDIEEAGALEAERYENIVPTVVRPKSTADDAIRIKYLDNKSLPLEVAILKQFTFSSELQRMSVVVRKLGAQNMDVYVKGSPEMIASLCKKETIPENLEECLVSYTKQGYRVLALSCKSLPHSVQWHKIQHYSRDQAECELDFLGFIIMKNLLKPITPSIIEKLHSAKVRTVMVTGDNMLTAVSVARECEMVKPCEKIISIAVSDEGFDEKIQYHIVGELEHSMDGVSNGQINFNAAHLKNSTFHFAVTGKVFAYILKEEPEIYDRLLVHGTIFARMLPDQKTQLVEGLQNLGYSVGMCGDGANDCGALKRANAGISLSEAEASVASPFTSKVPNISCVVEVLKEGRCALVTSFNIFKYMALYSMIQYTSVLMLYYIGSNLGDLQFIYIDLFTIMPFAITMSRTGPSGDLVAKRPLGRLVHPIVLFSLVSHVLVQSSFQVLMFFYVRSLPEYKSIDYFTKKFKVGDDGTPIVSYETTALFTYTSYQYVLVAVVFAVGRPFRKPFYTNSLLVLSIVCLLALNTVLTVKPASLFLSPFEIVSIQDSQYYYVFYGLLFCNLLVSILIENGILELRCMQRALKALRGKKQESKYQRLKKDAQFFEDFHKKIV